MTSETDLSTADLAQPRGPRQPERSETDARAGERAYETTGNRAVDPTEQETAEMPRVAPGTGSTRDDARPPTADPARGSAEVDDRAMTDRGTAQRDDDQDTAGTGGGDVALLEPQDAEEMRRRWSDTQARFVDDPREAVQTADALVAELMQTLARSFSAHKGELEGHWRSGGDPDTEQLRQALQRYRSFFDRLLSA